MRVFGEKDAVIVKQLEAGIRCSWNWSWLKLESRVTGKGQVLSFHLPDVFRKISKQGFAHCILCQKDINDSNKGSHALQTHSQTEVHKKKEQVIASYTQCNQHFSSKPRDNINKSGTSND